MPPKIAAKRGWQLAAPIAKLLIGNCFFDGEGKVWFRNLLSHEPSRRGGSLQGSGRVGLDFGVHQYAYRWLVLLQRSPVDELSRPVLSRPLGLTTVA